MEINEKNKKKEQQALIIRKYQQYLKLEKSLSPNTLDAYLTDLDKLMSFLTLEGIDVLEVCLSDLQRFAAGLHDIGIHPRSQARILSGIKSFFRFLIMADYLEADPSELLEGPKIGLKLPEVLTVEEIDNIISVKENYPKGSPFTIKGFIKQLGTSIWALAAVVIVVFGVVGGVFTATESAAIAVIYSLLVSVFVYKGLDWKGVWHALDECVNTLSIVLILIATSAVFGNCLTMLHVPDLAANAITSVTSNPYIIALLIDLIILVLGMIMDMAPIILIATPILLPIATSIGIDPIQFGIIMVLNCGIGLLTPPVGAVLFIGSAVAKRPMEKVVKATLPFYLCMFIALLLLTFVPDISLAIPKLLGGYVSPITNPLGPVFIH